MEGARELDDGAEPRVAEGGRALVAVQRHAVAEHELVRVGAVPAEEEDEKEIVALAFQLFTYVAQRISE